MIWPHYLFDNEDLRADNVDDFVTIPPPNQGSYSIRHEVPRDMIIAANLEKGEKYRVALTDICLGTIWWTFGSRDELDGVRIRRWGYRAEHEALADDPDSSEEYKTLKQEYEDTYGTGPATQGEKPDMLALVREGEPAEFEVV